MFVPGTPRRQAVNLIASILDAAGLTEQVAVAYGGSLNFLDVGNLTLGSSLQFITGQGVTLDSDLRVVGDVYANGVLLAPGGAATPTFVKSFLFMGA